MTKMSVSLHNFTHELHATLDIKYISWADVSTKYPLLFASGENYDMACSSTTVLAS